MLHDPRAQVIVVYTKPVSEMRFATASKLLHIYIACQNILLCTLTQKSFNLPPYRYICARWTHYLALYFCDLFIRFSL